MEKTRNLHHLLTELIEKYDLEPIILEQKVFALWQQQLGAPLGTKTVPVSLSNGILKVYTEYPPYRQHLSLLKQKILDDLNAELGQPILTDLRIELRQVHAARSRETEHPPSNEKAPEAPSKNFVTPEQLEKIEQALTSVLDPQLRESLWQLFTTQSENTP